MKNHKLFEIMAQPLIRSCVSCKKEMSYEQIHIHFSNVPIINFNFIDNKIVANSTETTCRITCKCHNYIYSVSFSVTDNVISNIYLIDEFTRIYKDHFLYTIINDYRNNTTYLDACDKQSGDNVELYKKTFPLISDNLSDPQKVLDKMLKLGTFL